MVYAGIYTFRDENHNVIDVKHNLNDLDFTISKNDILSCQYTQETFQMLGKSSKEERNGGRGANVVKCTNKFTFLTSLTLGSGY